MRNRCWRIWCNPPSSFRTATHSLILFHSLCSLICRTIVTAFYSTICFVSISPLIFTLQWTSPGLFLPNRIVRIRDFRMQANSPSPTVWLRIMSLREQSIVLLWQRTLSLHLRAIRRMNTENGGEFKRGTEAQHRIVMNRLYPWAQHSFTSPILFNWLMTIKAPSKKVHSVIPFHVFVLFLTDS